MLKTYARYCVSWLVAKSADVDVVQKSASAENEATSRPSIDIFVRDTSVPALIGRFCFDMPHACQLLNGLFFVAR